MLTWQRNVLIKGKLIYQLRSNNLHRLVTQWEHHFSMLSNLVTLRCTSNIRKIYSFKWKELVAN